MCAGRIINILSATVSDDRCATPPGNLAGPMHGDVVVPKPPPTNTSLASFSTSASDIVPLNCTTRLAKLTDYGGYVVTREERYTAAHFHEMGRGLMTAALDMWSVNPWSRLATTFCSDITRFRPGSYCNLKTLASTALRFGKMGLVRSGGRIPTRLRQAELANMKVGNHSVLSLLSEKSGFLASL